MARTRLWTLGSGSQGNAAVVGHRDADGRERLLLLDAGFELPELVARLQAAGLHPFDVDDVVLSHGHRDHVLGAAAGARAYGWRTWGSLGTVWRWRALREIPLLPFAPGDAFDAGVFRVHTTPVPHDVDDAAAFVVEARDTGTRVGYATDLGEAPHALVTLLRGVDALVLEANHDPALLAAGPYPAEVRARVAGATGHLSNAQAAALARAIAHRGLRQLVLGHVSRHNNTPALARAAVEAALVGTRFRGALHVAPQDAVLGPLAVDAGAGHGRCTPGPVPTPELPMRDDQRENDRSEYTDTGFRDQDAREGFGDDQGTRIGRPDGTKATGEGHARVAPRDASGTPRPGQPGTNTVPVSDGLEGSLTDDDASDEGAGQRRVQRASEGLTPGAETADERRTFDL